MITITILTLCFLAALSCKIKKVKAPVVQVLLWYFHLFLGSICLVCLFLMFNNYGFKGTQTERVFFTLYAGTGMLLYGLAKPGNDARYAYLMCFFGFPFVLLLGLLIPPLRTITLVAAITLLSDSEFQRFDIDNDFALQTKSTGILSTSPVYSLVADKYLLFEKLTPDVIRPGAAPGFLKMEKRGKDSVSILLKTTGAKVDTVLLLPE